MLLFFLLLILVAAIVANVQIHKWKRLRRQETKALPRAAKRARQPAAPVMPELDEIDWEAALGLDELEQEAAAAPPRAVEVKDEFFPLERALMQAQMTGPHRRDAMAQLLTATLHVPAPEPGERHRVLELEDGRYVPAATHPAAAAIALGHLAEGMQQCKGEQILKELRGDDLGLLVVARNPQKPSVARLWKIRPEDL